MTIPMQTFVVMRAYLHTVCTGSTLLKPTSAARLLYNPHITTLQSGPDRTRGCPAAGCRRWAAAPEGMRPSLVRCQLLLLAAHEPCPQTVGACTRPVPWHCTSYQIKDAPCTQAMKAPVVTKLKQSHGSDRQKVSLTIAHRPSALGGRRSPAGSCAAQPLPRT
jgi:hypothetical protein